MKIIHTALIASGFLLYGQTLAAEQQEPAPAPVVEEAAVAPDAQPQPVQLSLAELDRITAGDLGLPNGKVIFAGFDNAAPGEFHPNFGRSPTGSGASGNEGPWSAAFNSPSIEFLCSTC